MFITIKNYFEGLQCHLFQESICVVGSKFAIKVWLAKAYCERMQFLISGVSLSVLYEFPHSV